MKMIQLFLIVSAIALFSPCLRADDPFLRGDVNGDGRLSITDTQLLECLALCHFPLIPCEDAADVNDDGRLDLSDMVALLEPTGSVASVSKLRGRSNGGLTRLRVLRPV